MLLLSGIVGGQVGADDLPAQAFIGAFEQADDSVKDKILEDILIGVSALGYQSELDVESVLREALIRFRIRFSLMESYALQNGKALVDLSDKQKAVLWRKAGDAMRGEE